MSKCESVARADRNVEFSVNNEWYLNRLKTLTNNDEKFESLARHGGMVCVMLVSMDKKPPQDEPQGRFAEVKKKAAEQRALKNRQARENAERNAARIAKENEGREP
jgi:hypothetical protein